MFRAPDTLTLTAASSVVIRGYMTTSPSYFKIMPYIIRLGSLLYRLFHLRIHLLIFLV